MCLVTQPDHSVPTSTPYHVCQKRMSSETSAMFACLLRKRNCCKVPVESSHRCKWNRGLPQDPQKLRHCCIAYSYACPEPKPTFRERSCPNSSPCVHNLDLLRFGGLLQGCERSMSLGLPGCTRTSAGLRKGGKPMHLHLNIEQSLKYLCTIGKASMVCGDLPINLVCAVYHINMSASGDLNVLAHRPHHIPGLV